MVVQQAKRRGVNVNNCVWELTGSVLTLVVVDILTQSTDPSSTLIPKSTWQHMDNLLNCSGTEWSSEYETFINFSTPKTWQCFVSCSNPKLLNLQLREFNSFDFVLAPAMSQLFGQHKQLQSENPFKPSNSNRLLRQMDNLIAQEVLPSLPPFCPSPLSMWEQRCVFSGREQTQRLISGWERPAFAFSLVCFHWKKKMGGVVQVRFRETFICSRLLLNGDEAFEKSERGGARGGLGNEPNGVTEALCDSAPFAYIM